MEQWAWIELQAQVEDHGHGAVKFFNSRSLDAETGDYEEFTVSDILFEDDTIRVVLE